MAVLKLVMVLLLVAYASAATFNELYQRFNTTIKGQCKPGAATTAAASGPTAAATTEAETGTTVATPTSDPNSVGRKNRNVDTPPCDEEEKNVLATDNPEDFKTNLNVLLTCTQANCTTLSKDVDRLIKDSGASAVKVCGLLLVLLIAMSYFG